MFIIYIDQLVNLTIHHTFNANIRRGTHRALHLVNVCIIVKIKYIIFIVFLVMKKINLKNSFFYAITKVNFSKYRKNRKQKCYLLLVIMLNYCYIVR